MKELITYKHKVQYYETDQMSIVHHSNYIRWFEEARIDFLEQIGMNMEEIERNGVQIPVLSVSSNYRSSVKATRVHDRLGIIITAKNNQKI